MGSYLAVLISIYIALIQTPECIDMDTDTKYMGPVPQTLCRRRTLMHQETLFSLAISDYLLL